MKKLLIATAIIMGTFAGINAASAHDNVVTGTYTGWASTAINSGYNN